MAFICWCGQQNPRRGIRRRIGSHQRGQHAGEQIGQQVLLGDAALALMPAFADRPHQRQRGLMNEVTRASHGRRQAVDFTGGPGIVEAVEGVQNRRQDVTRIGCLGNGLPGRDGRAFLQKFSQLPVTERGNLSDGVSLFDRPPQQEQLLPPRS